MVFANKIVFNIDKQCTQWYGFKFKMDYHYKLN